MGESKVVRRGLVFRSSEPSKVTDDGVSKLQDLGIAKVFDLRSAVEIEKGLRDGYGWKIKEWDGASRHFVPVFLDQDYSPEALAVRYKNYSSEHAEVRIAITRVTRQRAADKTHVGTTQAGFLGVLDFCLSLLVRSEN